MPKSPDSHVWYDGLFDFSLGMDSGVQPLLIKRNQAAFITNGTVRQTFLQPRPAFNKLALNYGGNAALQTAFETGLFQGACFYNPDYGNQCLMASVAGQLFQFSIAGTTATVSNVSIPGDPQSATATQAWLWQSENYVIWNDGISLPVFYNGNSSRRSNGAERVLASITGGFAAPAVGASVVVTLAAPYTGPLNVAVGVVDPTNGTSYYQTATAGVAYFVELTNESDSPGAAISIGDQIVSRPSVAGVLSGSYGPDFLAGPGPTRGPIVLTLPYTGAIGAQIMFGGFLWTVDSASGSQLDVITFNGPNNSTIPFQPPGSLVTFAAGSAPNVVVGTVVAGATAPATGGTVQVQMSVPYVGPNNAPVFDGDRQYTIMASPATISGNNLTLINLTDVAGTNHGSPDYDLDSVPELPAGRMGAYGMGRNWMSLVDGLSFIASDIVGGSSGTPATSARDAVLHITENNYLAGGGVFRIPGSVGNIRSMIFTAQLDTSMGQGPLQVFTPTNVFSCDAPVDRTKWQDLTNPILTQSLIANGAQGQNSTIAVNGDTFFRSVDGIRSLILGQRQFSTWGNVPLSLEMDRVIRADNTALLAYASAAVFDNRVIVTASPVSGPQGVYHTSAVALNLDPIRSIDEKTQPIYDGQWQDLNVLQYVSGVVNGVQRLFAFTYNPADMKLEIYEILTDDGGTFDNGSTPIVWGFESASLFKDIKQKGLFDLIRLEDGEIYVDEVVGDVNFQVFYKPDQHPCWTPWYSWDVTGPPLLPPNAVPADCTLSPGFRTRMGLGKPSASACDLDTGFPMREGSTFQFKFIITGQCRLLGTKFMAVTLPDVFFAKPICP